MRPSDLLYAPLAGVLLGSNRAFGSIWAWRITRFVHALPFFAGAFGFGCLSGWFWGVPPPLMSGAICAGGVMLLTARDWFRDWRRG